MTKPGREKETCPSLTLWEEGETPWRFFKIPKLQNFKFSHRFTTMPRLKKVFILNYLPRHVCVTGQYQYHN